MYIVQICESLTSDQDVHLKKKDNSKLQMYM